MKDRCLLGRMLISLPFYLLKEAFLQTITPATYGPIQRLKDKLKTFKRET